MFISLLQDTVQHKIDFHYIDGFFAKDAKKSTVGACSDDLAHFIIGHIIRFCNTCYLILRCCRGNMGIKPTAGTSNKTVRLYLVLYSRVR